jgi:segregation and condensation protein A
LLNAAEDMRAELLITFLSALELGKMGFVNVFQSDVYGDIYLTAKRQIDEHALERVQEYNSLDSEQVANSLFEAEETVEASLDEPESEQLELGADEQYPDVEASDDDILNAEKEMNLESTSDREPEGDAHV